MDQSEYYFVELGNNFFAVMNLTLQIKLDAQLMLRKEKYLKSFQVLNQYVQASCKKALTMFRLNIQAILGIWRCC